MLGDLAVFWLYVTLHYI